MRTLLGGDLRETPVGIGAAELVQRHAREPARLVHGLAGATRERMTLQPRGRAAHADPRPAPGDVDVVRERDGEPRAPVERRLGAELPAQPLERRIERVETRGSGEEASVPVELGPPLLDPRQVEEARRERRLLAAARRARRPPTPRRGTGTSSPRRTSGRSHHVEHPARPLLDRSGDRHGASVVRQADWPSRQRATIGPVSSVQTPARPSGAPDAGDGRSQSLVSQLLELSRHSVIYGIGGLMSRFLAVFMLPLYTSYVSAGDYGRIELLMSLMAVVVVVVRGGANFGFIRFYFLDKAPDYRRRLVRTVFWAQMTYSTLALALCVLFASQIANGLGINDGPQSAGERHEPRHRHGRPALGERQLRPDDEPLPGREAVGRLHHRDAPEHRHHRPAHGDSRRRLQAGPARDHRRQPQRHAGRVHRAARLPPRAARPPVRPAPAADR